MVKNPNWQGADQLTIYKCGYQETTQTARPHCLPNLSDKVDQFDAKHKIFAQRNHSGGDLSFEHFMTPF